MTDQFIAAEDRLVDAMAESARGPRQTGAYALWLFVRQCDGYLPPSAVSPEASATRLGLLERRLSSLSLPSPLRRALNGSLRELKADVPPDVAFALEQLVAPARDALGPAVSDAVARAARKAAALAREQAVVT